MHVTGSEQKKPGKKQRIPRMTPFKYSHTKEGGLVLNTGNRFQP
jgi:hypothetical protein